jgi:hypothetical protein
MTTTTRQDKIARGKALTAEKSTPVLVASLRSLGPQIDKAREVAAVTGEFEDCQALGLVRSWVVTALEDRYPHLADALDAAFEADEDADYDAVLIANIPEADKL